MPQVILGQVRSLPESPGNQTGNTKFEEVTGSARSNSGTNPQIKIKQLDLFEWTAISFSKEKTASFIFLFIFLDKQEDEI